MKIAMVFDGLQIGGVERVGADYAKLLINLGHDVTIFNLVPELMEMEKEFPKGCKIINAYFPNKICPERYNKVMRIKSWGKWIFPPVSLALSFMDRCYKIILKVRKPFHTSFDLAIAFSGHYNDLTFVACNFINAKHKVCWLHGALYSYLLTSDGFLNLYKKIKNLVVLTRDCEEEVMAYNPFLVLNIHHLYNPVSYCDKHVSLRNIEDLKTKYGDYILMVSRMSLPAKRPDILIDAFEICWGKYGLRKNLVFVGDGPDFEKMKQYAMSKKRDIAKHIFFEGSRNNVQDYYASAAILVQSSTHEGLPTTIIEGLQMGIPVVASDCQTGPREILGDNQYGLLCKVGDAKDMASKIYQLASNGDMAARYKEVGKIRGKDFYPETIQARLKLLLNDLLSTK